MYNQPLSCDASFDVSWRPVGQWQVYQCSAVLLEIHVQSWQRGKSANLDTPLITELLCAPCKPNCFKIIIIMLMIQLQQRCL